MSATESKPLTPNQHAAFAALVRQSWRPMSPNGVASSGKLQKTSARTALGALCARGLVELSGTRYRLTEDGFALAEKLFSDEA